MFNFSTELYIIEPHCQLSFNNSRLNRFKLHKPHNIVDIIITIEKEVWFDKREYIISYFKKQIYTNKWGTTLETILYDKHMFVYLLFSFFVLVLVTALAFATDVFDCPILLNQTTGFLLNIGQSGMQICEWQYEQENV